MLPLSDHDVDMMQRWQGGCLRDIFSAGHDFGDQVLDNKIVQSVARIPSIRTNLQWARLNFLGRVSNSTYTQGAKQFLHFLTAEEVAQQGLGGTPAKFNLGDKVLAAAVEALQDSYAKFRGILIDVSKNAFRNAVEFDEARRSSVVRQCEDIGIMDAGKIIPDATSPASFVFIANVFATTRLRILHPDDEGRFRFWKDIIRVVKNVFADTGIRNTETCACCGHDVAEEGGLRRHLSLKEDCLESYACDPSVTSDVEDGNGVARKACPFHRTSCRYPRESGHWCILCRRRSGEPDAMKKSRARQALNQKCKYAVEKKSGEKHIPFESRKKWKCLHDAETVCAFPKLGTAQGWCLRCLDLVGATPMERLLIKP